MLRRNRSFRWLTLSQGLGAFNDNAYKQFILLLLVVPGLGLQVPGGFDPQATGMAVFSISFVLLALFGGSLADRYSKRRVIVVMNMIEILVMVCGLLAFTAAVFANIGLALNLSLLVLLLMGAQSAIFGPSKYGAIPEIVDESQLSRANGIISMTTNLGIVAGTVVAGSLVHFVIGSDGSTKLPLHYAGFFFVAVAIIGFAGSLRIQPLPPADPGRRIAWGVHKVPLHAVREFRWLAGDRPLLLAVIGNSWYFFVAALAAQALNQYGATVLGRLAGGSDLFLGIALGIAAGSLLASRLSREQIELGLVPIGSVILAAGIGALAFLPDDLGWSHGIAGLPQDIPLLFPTASLLVLIAGIGAGIYVVPLLAFIQARPSREEKGRVTGIHELANFLFIFLAAIVYGALAPLLTEREMMLAIAGFTLIGTAAIFFAIPHLAVRMTLWGLLHTIYRVRVLNPERIPRKGGALVVANHLSYADPFLVGAAMPRYVRFLIHRDLIKVRLVGFFARLMRTIPVASTDSPREILRSLDEAGKAVAEGDLTCIFAEGGISRTGNLLPFSRGLERIAARADVPIIPIFLGRVWGSIFSFKGGRFFFKRPLKLPYPVTVAVGEPLPPGSTAGQVRRAVQELSVEVMESRKRTGHTLATEFFDMAKRRSRHTAIIEHDRPPLSFRKVLIGSLLLRRLLRERLRGQESVGVLLPASSGGALANVALAVLGKTSVNLNFTAGSGSLRSAVEQTGIRTVISAAQFLRKIDLDPGDLGEGVEVIDLARLMKDASGLDRAAAVLTSLLPRRRLSRLADVPQDPDAIATVVFSSGSTGSPKGVMLSHHNLLSNVRSISEVFDPRRDDRIVGTLPFFHSFGYTITIWFPLLNGITVAYHPNPTDVKVVAELLREQRGTMFLSTPTFYRTYLRRFSKEDFTTVRLAVCGAEKLKRSLAEEWEAKFGQPLYEGYGCTELAPVVSVNLPDILRPGGRQRGGKSGTIGHPVPGVVPRIVDPESFEELPNGEEGLLLVKGSNVMVGYLGRPEETAEVIRDGWYVTGDIARLDDDGFLTITDRLSRFSKLGGEMVPHVLVEERLQEVVDRIAEERALDPIPQLAVTSIPDATKGERLAVVHSPLPVTAEELLDGVSGSDLPRLWIPRRDAFVEVEEVPRLGSGKLDLKGVKQIALDRLGGAAE